MTFSFWRRQKRERELEEELQSHLEMAASDRMERGESPGRARDAALREIGNLSVIKEVTRDNWGWRWLEDLAQDFRYSLRTMRRSLGFCAVAIVTLALGIGANTAIFSLMDAFLWRTLPAKDPQQLVFVRAMAPDGRTFGDFPYREFEYLRDRNNSFSGMFAYDSSNNNVTVDGQSEIVADDFVSGNYFEVLGVNAFLGRTLTADDDHAGRKPVAVISYAYWQKRFAGSETAIGKTIYVGQMPFTIIGVTSAEFFGRNVAGRSANVVLPMWVQPQLGLKDHDTFDIMGRLKPEVSLEQARADLDVDYRQVLMEEAASSSSTQVEPGSGGEKILLRPALRGEDPPTENFGTEIRILAVVVGVALLIACVNVAGLLVARASSRQREIAVRVAMGAGRGRLIRQLLTESVLLALIGGALGVLVAKWGVSLLVTVLAYGYAPIPFDLSPNARVLAFTAGMSILTGILFGLAPALSGTRVDLNPVLKGAAWREGSNILRRGLAKSFVVAQVALSLALLIGAGLLLRSLKQLYAVDVGYDGSKILTMWVFPAMNDHDHAREMNLYRELYEKLNTIPGVQSASLSRLRMVYGNWNRKVWAQGEAGQRANAREVYCDPAGPRFFETMGIGLLLGREFSFADTETSPKVAIISESMARTFFLGVNPIGQRFGFAGAKSSGDIEVVGVVKDIKHRVGEAEPQEAAWIPYTQAPADMFGQMTLVVRTAAIPANIAPAMRAAAQSADKNLPLGKVETESAELDDYLGGWRSMGTLLSFFGGLALVLAALGLYGAMSYLVGRRTKELGIRLALGAQKRGMLWMVLREAGFLVATGVGFGVPMAVAASRLISSMLFGVKATDGVTISSAILVMSVVALLAAYLPARRATRVDPIVALRYE
ncbi:MAG TPA: ABC transporter permease [Candidatus Methylomirabilis sp.]|nr:ABC transporter permease [Candidatus Methylomirabilis sp.]